MRLTDTDFDWAKYAKQELDFLDDIVYLVTEIPYDPSTPFKLLYAAIINRAIKDYCQENIKQKDTALMESAWKWLFIESADNLDQMYSFESERDRKLAEYTTFENCCLVLGWDPDYIRSLVRNRKKTILGVKDVDLNKVV